MWETSPVSPRAAGQCAAASLNETGLASHTNQSSHWFSGKAKYQDELFLKLIRWRPLLSASAVTATAVLFVGLFQFFLA